MPAHHQNFFRVFAPANLPDHVRGLHRTVGKRILHIEPHARRDAPLQETFQLSLVFRGHGHHGHSKIRVEAENARVRQVHAVGPSAALSADDRDRARLSGSFQEIAKQGKEIHLILAGLPFGRDQNDFSFQVRDILTLVFDVEHVDGHHVPFRSSRRG